MQKNSGMKDEVCRTGDRFPALMERQTAQALALSNKLSLELGLELVSVFVSAHIFAMIKRSIHQASGDDYL